MYFENPPNQNKKSIISEIFQSRITNSYLIFLLKPYFGIHSTSQGEGKKKTKRSISHKCFCLSKRIPALFSAVCTSTIYLSYYRSFFPFYCGVSWHRTCHLIRFDMTSPIYHKLDSTYLLSLGVEFRKFQKHPIGA